MIRDVFKLTLPDASPVGTLDHKLIYQLESEQVLCDLVLANSMSANRALRSSLHRIINPLSDTISAEYMLTGAINRIIENFLANRAIEMF